MVMAWSRVRGGLAAVIVVMRSGLEDSGQMAKFLSETMDVTVALIDRPWNQDIDFNGKVHRCMDWDDVKTKFETL